VLDYQPMGLEQQPYDLEVFVEAWANLWKQVRIARWGFKDTVPFCALVCMLKR
jgi:hypothetical protein